MIFCRIRGLSLILGLSAFVCFGSVHGIVNAHTIFKKGLEKAYEGVKVSCDACHVKGKKKTERNEGLGKLFFEELKDQNLTEQWKAKKGKEKKDYQADVMLPAFKKALKVVKEKKNDAGETYHSLIEKAELDGLKLKPKSDEEE